jgi:hypothetical protein
MSDVLVEAIPVVDESILALPPETRIERRTYYGEDGRICIGSYYVTYGSPKFVQFEEHPGDAHYFRPILGEVPIAAPLCDGGVSKDKWIEIRQAQAERSEKAIEAARKAASDSKARYEEAIRTLAKSANLPDEMVAALLGVSVKKEETKEVAEATSKKR